MTKYREILRLSALGLTLREIAASLQVSQHTIIDVRRRAKELDSVNIFSQIQFQPSDSW